MSRKGILHYTQSIFINALQTILSTKNIWEDAKIYISVPIKTKTPYLKVTTVSINNNPMFHEKGSDIVFLVELFQQTKNSQEILDVMNQIQSNLPTLILNQSIEQITILNAIISNLKIEEILSPQYWKGYLSVQVISKIK